MTNPVVLAVDGNSLVHRSFHALASTGLRSDRGEPIWAVRGLLSQLVAAVERIGPTAVVIGFDDPQASIRRDRWPHYKAQRSEKLDSLVRQLVSAADVLAELGLHVVIPPGLEADDVLASAAAFAAGIGAETVVVTSDRDAFAMIDERTSVLRIINGGVDASPLLTPQRLVTMLGITPCQYRDYAALRGDPSDNLPGVRGIGPKTAAKLLGALGSAAAAFADVRNGGTAVRDAVGARVAERLADSTAEQNWTLNCQIMALHSTVQLGLDLDGGRGTLPLAADTVREIFHRHQLPSTLPTALRVLAHEDGPHTAAVYASAAVGVAASDGSRRSDRGSRWRDEPRQGRWTGRRHPPLPAKPVPAQQQLALF